ncbi:hypothetical protein OAN05_00920 [bacterium]|nr:hypothetical protein [bacterium]
MQIVGVVLLLLGMVKMAKPVEFNKNIFGEIPEAEVAKLASMRMILGGVVTGIGLINLICSFMIDDAESAKAVMVSTGVAMLVFWGSIIAANLRGFIDHIPKPPMVLLPVLSIISFIGAYA